MQLLSKTKSSIGSPYVFYVLNAYVVDNTRTENSVQITFETISNLQYSASYLGGSYPITGYVEINGTEYSIPIKQSGDGWSGTAEHTAQATYTISGLGASDTEIQNVKFRTYQNNDSGTLYQVNTNNIQIPIGHTPPSNITYTMTETNSVLSGVADNVFVENLSIKRFNITATLYDSATATRYGVYNRITPHSGTTNPYVLDCSTFALNKNDAGTKIPIRAYVKDSFNSQGVSDEELYNFIPYTKVNLIETSTTARRYGQTSGRVRINVLGNYYNGIVGNIDQSGTYKPIIKYKFWRSDTSEPASYDYTVPSASITINNGQVSVSNYEIGSSVETDPNYFDPDYSYRVKIQILDNFTIYNSGEKTVPLGEATWTEYKDRVDFKDLTKKSGEIYGEFILYNDATGSNSTITLSDSVANYNYIEINYRSNDSVNHKMATGRIYNPNSGVISLIYHRLHAGATVYVKQAQVVINNNQITFDNSVEWDFSDGSNVSLRTTSNIYITRVIGYK